MRTIADIDEELDAVGAELARVSTMLDRLRLERTLAVRQRNAAMCADFDAGLSMRDIAARHGVKPGFANGILWRHGRRVYKRKKPISHLPAEQQRLYHKARHAGIGPAAARQIAESVAP